MTVQTPANTQTMTASDALLDAVRDGRLKDVESLLGQGVDIDGEDSTGYTPLTAAALYDREDVVRLLLDRKADVNKKDRGGQTALIVAAGKASRIGIARLLLDHDAAVDEKSSFENTALITAARGGSYDLVALFIEKGAALDEKNKRGETALFIAVQGLEPRSQEDHVKTVKLLVEAGADCDQEDKDGRTAQQLAENRNYFEVIDAISAALETRRERSEVQARTEERASQAQTAKAQHEMAMEKQQRVKQKAPKLKIKAF